MEKKEILEEIKKIVEYLEDNHHLEAGVLLDGLYGKAQTTGLYEDKEIFALLTEIDLFLKESSATTLENIKEMLNRAYLQR